MKKIIRLNEIRKIVNDIINEQSEILSDFNEFSKEKIKELNKLFNFLNNLTLSQMVKNNPNSLIKELERIEDEFNKEKKIISDYISNDDSLSDDEMDDLQNNLDSIVNIFDRKFYFLKSVLEGLKSIKDEINDDYLTDEKAFDDSLKQTVISID